MNGDRKGQGIDLIQAEIAAIRSSLLLSKAEGFEDIGYREAAAIKNYG